jgi:hypothetical protein
MGVAKAPVCNEQDDAVPPRAKRKAFGIANKPQMGVSIFSMHGQKSRSPAYIQYVDAEQNGEAVTLFFQHMKMNAVGKGLDALIEGFAARLCTTFRCSMSPSSRRNRKSAGSRAFR